MSLVGGSDGKGQIPRKKQERRIGGPVEKDPAQEKRRVARPFRRGERTQDDEEKSREKNQDRGIGNGRSSRFSEKETAIF